jgi:hypothetical protein
MNHNKLPADSTAMILGIIALVLGLAGCCCYGIVAIVPLTMSIIGLVMANKSIREFNENPEAYSPQSRSNVATAKIINIIALEFNSIIFIFFIIVFFLYGTLFSAAIMDSYKQSQNEYNDYYEWENDSLYDNEENVIKAESDSIYIDSINIEEIKDVKNNLEN